MRCSGHVPSRGNPPCGRNWRVLREHLVVIGITSERTGSWNSQAALCPQSTTIGCEPRVPPNADEYTADAESRRVAVGARQCRAPWGDSPRHQSSMSRTSGSALCSQRVCRGRPHAQLVGQQKVPPCIGWHLQSRYSRARLPTISHGRVLDRVLRFCQKFAGCAEQTIQTCASGCGSNKPPPRMMECGALSGQRLTMLRAAGAGFGNK